MDVSQQFFDTVPSAQSRVLIDMVNSLDVAGEHLRVASRHENGGVVQRLWGALSGETQKRNNRIAQSQHIALESVVATVTTLTQSVTASNLVLTKVANRLTFVEHSLAKTAGVVVQTREAVRHLQSHVEEQVLRLDGELARMDLRAAAGEHLNHVLSRWEAGRFDRFPIASRAYIALHELYWGAFGEYLRRHTDDVSARRLRETLQNKVQARLKYTVGDNAIPLAQWLALDASVEVEEGDLLFFQESLAYLGSYAQADTAPWVYTLTQLPEKMQVPLRINRICDADLVAKRLSNEMFEQEVAYA